MSDRLLVMASVLCSAFVLSGTALVFAQDVATWSTRVGAGEAGGALWATSLHRLHAASPLVSVLGVMGFALVAVAWQHELRRIRLRETALDAPVRGGLKRSSRLALSFHRAFSASLPVMAIVLLSGVAVFVLQGRGGALVSERTSVMVASFHGGAMGGGLQQFLWVFTGLNIALLNVFVTRIRAARLGEAGVPSFRAYEDIPQGASLGVILGVLAGLAIIAWGGPVGAIPAVVVFAICWSIAVHLWAPMAESGGWRIVPLVLVAAVIGGDVLRGVDWTASTLKVWGFALALGFGAILLARVGRRTLVSESAAPQGDAP